MNHYCKIVFYIIQIWDALKKKPVFGYFLRDLPDATARKLFSSVQIHIWAVEGEL